MYILYLIDQWSEVEPAARLAILVIGYHRANIRAPVKFSQKSLGGAGVGSDQRVTAHAGAVSGLLPLPGGVTCHHYVIIMSSLYRVIRAYIDSTLTGY
jgi:hypothetical protein